jgi:glycerophosphoryl diester phosphodiesterase
MVSVGFFDRPGPLVLAHRGGCALGPENTLAAFDRGLAAGADGLELDVHLSADGVVVVHHDETLDRTTNASGPVASRTAAELARIDAGCRFTAAHAGAGTGGQAGPPADPGPTGIPRLEDVLARYADVPIVIEMKVDSREMGLAVARVVREAAAVDRVCAAGFGGHGLEAVRRALPQVDTSASRLEARLAVYGAWIRWPFRGLPYGGYLVPERAGLIRVVSPFFIRRSHANGLKVQVWTVDDRADIERLLAWGVDAIITDRPDVAVAVRDAFVARRGSR